MSRTKEIHLRESTRKLYAIAGYACMASGLLSLFLGSAVGVMVFTVGILNVVMATRARTTPIIVITRDYLEIKLAPLASKQFVAFDEIHRVERADGKLVLHTRAKEVKIPAKAMDDSEFDQLVRTVKARAG